MQECKSCWLSSGLNKVYRCFLVSSQTPPKRRDSGDIWQILPTLVATFSPGNSKSAGLAHTWTVKSWMQYSVSHVAAMALLLPKMDSEAISEHLHVTSQNFLGEHPTDPPQSCMVMHAYIVHLILLHVTPLLKILATGLTVQLRTRSPHMEGHMTNPAQVCVCACLF